MRITNNLPALNTHRQYDTRNKAVAGNVEKLASGYRINRAADDAAGLAISEKMRSQIRGLTMATKNSQDAISLVQTAEGALQETHSMLQRMNELAVQAATGTNEDFDREAIAKEFEQLKREINDVAEQTTFNNMRILDGSLSLEGFVRSAQTAGVTRIDEDAATVSEGSPLTLGPSYAGRPHVPAGGSPTGRAEIALASVSGDVGVNARPVIRVEYMDQNTGNLRTIEFHGKQPTTGSVPISQSFKDVAAVDSEGVMWTITVDAHENMTISSTQTGSVGIPLTGGVSVKYTPQQGQTATDLYVADVMDSGSQQPLDASPGYQAFSLDFDRLRDGDELTLNGRVYTFTAGADGTDGQSFSDRASLERAVAFDQGAGFVLPTAPTTGWDFIFQQKLDTGTSPFELVSGPKDVWDVSLKHDTAVSEVSGRTIIEFDFAKLRDGDTIEFSIGDTLISVEKEAGDTRASYMRKLIDQIGTSYKDGIADARVTGNAVIVEGPPVSEIRFTSGVEDQPTKAMHIQVGALEDEQLMATIDSMNTAGLKLDEHSLASQNSAGRAITAVRSAINKVSDQRAALGAMQNRLDHKISNLRIATENLSAAESRIRDVDMASEMTSFTKNNILEQAATAMLAQANALPQNVLSLLS